VSEVLQFTGGPVQPDPLYVVARRVLLDALRALAPYGRAVIVVGAQAVYLRTGEANMAIAPYTTDADLTLDPSILVDDPELESAMLGADFELAPLPGGHVKPGVWIATASVGGQELEIPVDLIVPAGVAGAGRRGARLGVHGTRAARQALGLEAALIDHSPMVVAALDPTDDRAIEVEVAGVAALLVAKAHKLHDRVESDQQRRIADKDASDVLRLMQTTSPSQVGTTFAALADDAVAGKPTSDGLVYIDELFGRRGRAGVVMAARALQLAMPEAAVETLCVAYTTELLAAARRS
jgi:hypothetical protein